MHHMAPTMATFGTHVPEFQPVSRNLFGGTPSFPFDSILIPIYHSLGYARTDGRSYGRKCTYARMKTNARTHEKTIESRQRHATPQECTRKHQRPGARIRTHAAKRTHPYTQKCKHSRTRHNNARIGARSFTHARKHFCVGS